MKKLILSALALLTLSQMQAQKTLVGYAYAMPSGSDYEAYLFCPDGRVYGGGSDFMSEFGTWTRQGADLKINITHILVREGKGKREGGQELWAGNVPDWYGYPQYRYTIQSHSNQFTAPSQEDLADNPMSEVRKLSATDLQNYCTQPLRLEGKYPMASVQELCAQDLAGLSKDELQIMRNEIFARHGLIFKTDKMKNYFTKQSWYKPRFDNVDDKLSPLEKKNIEFIKKREN